MKILAIRRVVRWAVTVLLVTAGMVAVGTGSPAGAVLPEVTYGKLPCQVTYTRSPGSTIPANNSMADVIDVPEDGLVVTDADVTLNLHHPSDPSLRISLTSTTDATSLRDEVALVDRPGGSGANFLGTVLDDSASQPLTWSNAPYTGRFKGTQSLAPLNGASGGRYDLGVTNSSAQTGTLDSWSMTFRYKSCDFDQDGVEDHVDRCTLLTGNTSSGCPLAPRKLSASYGSGAFKGSLTSQQSECKASRPVTVWKVHGGPDRKIGTVHTHANGSYRLPKAKRPGTYYATSPAAVVKPFQCPVSTSKSFTVG